MNMKKSKLFLTSVLILAALFICSIGALGTLATEENENPTITLVASGNQANFTFNRDDGNLFDNFSGVMPGDTLTQTITVESARGNSGQFRIYLYAAPGEETVPDFLKSMTLKVLSGGTELNVMDAYKESGVENPYAKGVLLGTFHPGDSKNLTVSLTLPIEMNNSFQNAKSFVDWYLYAEQSINSGGGEGPYPTPEPSPDDPPIDIPDDDTPAGDLPDADIPDDEIPGGDLPSGKPVPIEDIPKTGDSSNPLLWVMLMVGSGSGLTGLLVFGQNGRKSKERQMISHTDTER